jgi:hypothetical protein
MRCQDYWEVQSVVNVPPIPHIPNDYFVPPIGPGGTKSIISVRVKNTQSIAVN